MKTFKQLLAVIALVLSFHACLMVNQAYGIETGPVVNAKVNAQVDKVVRSKMRTTDYGTYGYFYVPSVGIGVPVDYIPEDMTGQDVVDLEDRAAFIDWWLTPTIADHAHQNFARLSEIKEGDTAFILYEDGGYVELRCNLVAEGTNVGDDLYINDDEVRASFKMNEMADLCCYTCRTEDWHDIWITTFEVVAK